MKKLYILLTNNIALYFFIKISATIFTLYVFGLFTPLVDTQIYMDISSSMGGAPLRTQIVHTIASCFSYISNPLFTHLIFSLFSGIGILILSYVLKNRFILLLLIAPSALIWTSIVGKEAIFYSAGTLLLALWTIYIKDSNKKLNITNCLTILSLFLLCIVFRAHYTIPLIYIFSSTYILTKFEQGKLRASLIILLFFMMLLVIVYLYLGADKPYNLILWGYEAIKSSGLSSRHEFFNIDPTQPYVTFNTSLIFKNSFFSIIGPFPSELHRIEFIPFFIEGLTILLFPIFGIFYFGNKDINNKYSGLFKLSILPAIFIVFLIHAPFGILNPGSAIRWRVNFELLFYAYPFVLMILSKKNSDKF